MVFVVELDNGEKQEMSFVQLRSLGLTNFTGFTCGTELSILSIDYRGGASISVCPQRNPINIFKHDIDTLFAPRICEQDECRNPSDLRILKVKIRLKCSWPTPISLLRSACTPNSLLLGMN